MEVSAETVDFPTPPLPIKKRSCGFIFVLSIFIIYHFDLIFFALRALGSLW
jgi:hypothetical protein